MPFSVVYDPRNPITGASKAAISATPLLSTSGDEEQQQRFLAMGRSKQNEVLVITSQTCDIGASHLVEPIVQAMRAFFARDARIIAEARHSVRRFLIDPIRGLVVDASAPMVMIEKPVLTNIVPGPGAPDIETERRFSRWLAERSSRPALPDEFVSTVKNPIVEQIRALAADPEFVLNELLGIRLVQPIAEDPPYPLRLIAILPFDAIPGSERCNSIMLKLATLFESFRGVYEAENVSSYQYVAKRLDELSARDYVASNQLSID